MLSLLLLDTTAGIPLLPPLSNSFRPQLLVALLPYADHLQPNHLSPTERPRAQILALTTLLLLAWLVQMRRRKDNRALHCVDRLYGTGNAQSTPERYQHGQADE